MILNKRTRDEKLDKWQFFINEEYLRCSTTTGKHINQFLAIWNVERKEKEWVQIIDASQFRQRVKQVLALY